MMGLAAYGKPKYFEKIRNNLFINEPKSLVKLNLKYFNHQNLDINTLLKTIWKLIKHMKIN